MCKLLCNPPHKLRPWEIAQLTPLQVRRIYGCERDEDGSVVIRPSDPLLELMDNPREVFFRQWRLLGLRDDQIEPLWERHDGEW